MAVGIHRVVIGSFCGSMQSNEIHFEFTLYIYIYISA